MCLSLFLRARQSRHSLLRHRHTPEIEQGLARATGREVRISFTPHLMPMNRGILATCYARPTGSTSTAEVLEAMRDSYADEMFVVVREGSPSTKATLGSNAVHVTAMADDRRSSPAQDLTTALVEAEVDGVGY